jgi:hypothetical protein
MKNKELWKAAGLQRQADPAKEIGEAWVASQRVESGIHPDEGHSIRTSQVAFLEPSEGLFFVA